MEFRKMMLVNLLAGKERRCRWRRETVDTVGEESGTS